MYNTNESIVAMTERTSEAFFAHFRWFVKITLCVDDLRSLKSIELFENMFSTDFERLIISSTWTWWLNKSLTYCLDAYLEIIHVHCVGGEAIFRFGWFHREILYHKEKLETDFVMMESYGDHFLHKYKIFQYSSIMRLF